MIRYLLLNAKFKMIKAEETQGVELCDTYVILIPSKLLILYNICLKSFLID